ncbi:hypothetical protein ABRZ82_11225 [Vibrio vulnificus]|uniref:hypothetical protein n=1 Tax=Vibrio vulnificus TaxID=672 RepID=UPI002FBDA1D5
MTWITLPSVSVQNGSKIVTVNNTQTTNIKVGDALLIGNYQPVEIAGVFATQLSLRTNWSNAAQANASAVVLPTFGDFNAATQALRQATQVTQGNFKTLEDWGTKLGNITFEGQDNSKHTARTLLQMDADVSELEEQANNLIVSLSGLNFALSKAIVDALRSGNKEQYAASGFIHYGKHFNSGNLSSVNEGMTVDIGTPNVIYLGARDGVTGGNVGGASKTSYPVMNVAGFEVHLLGINSTLTNWQASTIKLPVEPDGTTTYNKSTGAVVKHSDSATAFAVAEADSTGNTEVVINRVDMAGLEFFKRKVGEYLYPYGSPQCGYTEVDGIPTTEDTSRPITYFAAYDGDTTSRGRGWRLVDLTFAQLAVIMSNPKHNAWYNEEGELLQFGPRQRTIAGLGNGDWGNISPAVESTLNYSTNGRVIPQGIKDVALPLQGYRSDNYMSSYWRGKLGRRSETGLFHPEADSSDVAVDGECYFYVLATVPRLNTAAYNNANFMGSSKFSDNKFWHNSAVPRVTIDDAFSNASTDKSASGREDGKKAQFIYQSGQGGVIDWRLPARDMSGKEEAAKVFQKVVNGTYRGIEKLVKTTVRTYTTSNGDVGSLIAVPDYAVFSMGDVVYVEDVSGSYIKTTVKASGSNPIELDTQFDRKVDGKVIHEVKTNISVSGNFSTLDVIGPPGQILATPALANGWMGRWIPDLKTGTSPYQLTRKALSAEGGQYTDNGSTWTAHSDRLTSITNTITHNMIASRVLIDNYTAFAKQTKRSVNKPVLNGSDGIGDVIANAVYHTQYGALLVESMIGKVPKSDVAPELSYLKLVKYMVNPDGKFNPSSVHNPKHVPIDVAAPTNNSPAVKALWYQAATNQQCSLNFLWNEMVFDTNWRTPDKVWSGGSVSVAAGETFRAESSSAYAVAGLLMRCVKAVTANATVLGAMHVSVGGEVISLTDGQTYFKVVNNGWSDDSTIRNIGGVGTFNNENGDACLYGTDELAMPYGYTKNQAGAGKQVVGVDL